MFQYAFEILQQTEYWVDPSTKKKKLKKVDDLSAVEARNGLNMMYRHCSQFRDSILRWYLDKHPDGMLHSIDQEYRLIRDSDAVLFIQAQPMYKKLQEIANEGGY